MKKLAFIFALFIISCSNSDKFDSGNIYKIQIDSISYKYYLYGDFSLESPEYSGSILFDSLEKYIINYYWIINDTVVNLKNPKLNYGLNYGLNSAELFLIDHFGDTISAGKNFCLDEPLKIELLSPINNYHSSKTEILEYQYNISGWNCKENIRDSVITTEKDENNCFFWRVTVFTEQNTDFSESRKVCLED